MCCPFYTSDEVKCFKLGGDYGGITGSIFTNFFIDLAGLIFGEQYS